MEKKKWIILAAVILFGILAIYFSFFLSKTCKDEACFNKNLVSCTKSTYLNNAQDIIWLYTIQGKSQDSCLVNAKILSVKEGKASLSSLQGKDMDCYLPLKSITRPEADIEKCHGLLKEDLQSEIIKSMHAYILKNLGQIKEELTKII